MKEYNAYSVYDQQRKKGDPKFQLINLLWFLVFFYLTNISKFGGRFVYLALARRLVEIHETQDGLQSLYLTSHYPDGIVEATNRRDNCLTALMQIC